MWQLLEENFISLRCVIVGAVWGRLSLLTPLHSLLENCTYAIFSTGAFAKKPIIAHHVTSRYLGEDSYHET